MAKPKSNLPASRRRKKEAGKKIIGSKALVLHNKRKAATRKSTVPQDSSKLAINRSILRSASAIVELSSDSESEDGVIHIRFQSRSTPKTPQRHSKTAPQQALESPFESRGRRVKGYISPPDSGSNSDPRRSLFAGNDSSTQNEDEEDIQFLGARIDISKKRNPHIWTLEEK
jgi:hypothetical protein